MRCRLLTASLCSPLYWGNIFFDRLLCKWQKRFLTNAAQIQIHGVDKNCSSIPTLCCRTRWEEVVQLVIISNARHDLANLQRLFDRSLLSTSYGGGDSFIYLVSYHSVYCWWWLYKKMSVPVKYHLCLFFLFFFSFNYFLFLISFFFSFYFEGSGMKRDRCVVKSYPIL